MYSDENRLNALQKAAQSKAIAKPGSPLITTFSSLSQQAFPGVPKQQLKLHLLPSQYSANLRLIARFFPTSTNRKSKK
jgi:hypothetical protein